MTDMLTKHFFIFSHFTKEPRNCSRKKKKKATMKQDWKCVSVLCSLTYCGWLMSRSLNFLLPIYLSWNIRNSAPHGAVTQEFSSLFPRTFMIQTSAGVWWYVSLHGRCNSCHRREGISIILTIIYQSPSINNLRQRTGDLSNKFSKSLRKQYLWQKSQSYKHLSICLTTSGV